MAENIQYYYSEFKTHLMILAVIILASILLIITPSAFSSINYACVLKTVLGLNCPFCGMTRDFVLISQGANSIHNPFSLITFLLVFFIYPSFFVSFFLIKKRLLISYAWLKTIFFVVITIMFVFNNLN